MNIEEKLRGAIKSKMRWVNALVAVLGGLELMGSHLTALYGTEVAAGILLIGGVTNMVLRSITTSALEDK